MKSIAAFVLTNEYDLNEARRLLEAYEDARDALATREDDSYLPELEAEVDQTATDLANFITDCTRLNY